mmetsp:Transcript_29808/g.88273  ORF Transcript_29808/g.88273 Transcript_29808/m.88273 type:complete len:255 (-) Transcript_29808:45-809(-)
MDGLVTNLVVDFLEQVLHFADFHTSFDVLGEMGLILLRLLLLHGLHVLLHMTSKNVLAHCLSIKLLTIVANKALFIVRDVQAAIKGSLESSKYLGTSGGALEASVQQAVERAGAILRLNRVRLPISLLNTLVGVCQVQLGQNTTRHEQSDTVGGRIVSESTAETVFRQLVRVSSCQHNIASDRGIHNLARDVPLGKTNNKAVLASVVLVLILAHETETSTVVSLALTTAPVFHLEPAEVGRTLQHLDVAHLANS